MHQPIPVQGKWLGQVVRGYFNYYAVYYAVPTNSRALHVFRHFVAELWQRSLRRRSQKDSMTWERFTQLANDWLPKPKILHPWPERRFAVKHPSRMPELGPYGSVRGRSVISVPIAIRACQKFDNDRTI